MSDPKLAEAVERLGDAHPSDDCYACRNGIECDVRLVLARIRDLEGELERATEALRAATHDEWPEFCERIGKRAEQAEAALAAADERAEKLFITLEAYAPNHPLITGPAAPEPEEYVYQPGDEEAGLVPPEAPKQPCGHPLSDQRSAGRCKHGCIYGCFEPGAPKPLPLGHPYEYSDELKPLCQCGQPESAHQPGKDQG